MSDEELTLKLSDFLFATPADAKKLITSDKKGMGRSAAEKILEKNSEANTMAKEVGEERIALRAAIDKL